LKVCCQFDSHVSANLQQFSTQFVMSKTLEKYDEKWSKAISIISLPFLAVKVGVNRSRWSGRLKSLKCQKAKFEHSLERSSRAIKPLGP